MDGGLGDWPLKVIKNDAGTNRLVFFSPFERDSERGREGGRDTHTHTHPYRYQQGHGFAVLVVRNSTSAMDAWETCTPPPSPRSCQ